MNGRCDFIIKDRLSLRDIFQHVDCYSDIFGMTYAIAHLMERLDADRSAVIFHLHVTIVFILVAPVSQSYFITDAETRSMSPMI